MDNSKMSFRQRVMKYNKAMFKSGYDTHLDNFVNHERLMRDLREVTRYILGSYENDFPEYRYILRRLYVGEIYAGFVFYRITKTMFIECAERYLTRVSSDYTFVSKIMDDFICQGRKRPRTVK